MAAVNETIRTILIEYSGVDIEVDTILNDAKFSVYIANAIGKKAWVLQGNVGTVLASLVYEGFVRIDLTVTAAEDAIIVADLPNLLASLQVNQPQIDGVFSFSHVFSWGY